MKAKARIKEIGIQIGIIGDRMIQEHAESEEYKAYKVALEASNKKMAELEDKYWPDFMALQDEREMLENELLDQKKSRYLDPSKYGPEFVKWFDRIFIGTTTCGRLKLIWVNEAETHALVLRPGHRTWNGIGSTRYAPSEYWLIPIGTKTDANWNSEKGYIWTKEGRLNKGDWEQINKLSNQ